MTTETLLAQSPTSDIVKAFELALARKPEDSLSSEERVALVVAQWIAAMNTGGFVGLMANDPDAAGMMMNALYGMGASEAAGLTVDALGAAGDAAALQELDQRRAATVGDLSPQLLEYIRAAAIQV